MKAQDWFGVAVRTLGLWKLLTALGYGLGYVGEVNGWLENSGTNPHYYHLWTIANLACGLALLLGADLIVRIAYRSVRGPEHGESGAE
jgi:hypothetical protein